MQDRIIADKEIICPSSQPQIKGSKVFGLVKGTVEKPRIHYLKSPEPITDELIALSNPVTPTEIFRIAAPCAANGCKHFNGINCGLASKITDKFSIAEKELPSCSIRQHCRWYQQEGKTICFRCSQIITDNYNLRAT